METKADIRKQYRMHRDSIPVSQRRDMDCSIFKNVIQHAAYIQAEKIYVYVSFGSEVDTQQILAHAWSCGKRVAVPKVLSKEKMEFYYIDSMEELKAGSWGILEPEEKDPVDAGEALVIMPLLAFDKQFHRIGYGGGYYDRFLAKHQEHQTMALAYSIQQAEYLPAESVDVCPNIIVTEEMVYEGERR